MADIIARVTEVLNGRSKLFVPPILDKWKSLYFNISVHTTGVCPSYFPLRWDKQTKLWAITNSLYYPVYWLYPEYDLVFDRLFGAHPREPEITRELRKSLYKPYQQAPLTQAMDKCKAIISAENKYTLEIDDKDDNDYIWGKNFDGKNFVDYIFWHFKAICEDPNSLFIVMPDRPAKEMKGGKVTVKIVHVPTRRLLYFSREEVIFYEDDPDKADWAWYVNGASYLRFNKNEKGEWAQADGRQGYYAHMLGKLPVHFAGGVWNNHGFYDSYIQPAIPFCDEMVGAMSAVQLVNKEASHPFIIAASTDCPECNGIGSYQWCRSCSCKTTDGCTCNDQSNYGLQTCHKCHGTKQQSHNPGDWMIVPPDEMGNDLIKFINPDVSINEYLVKYKDDVYESIRAALHQQYVEEAQSGVAKEIDRDGERLWYKTCNDGMWRGLIEPLLVDILSLRNISKAGGKISTNIPKYTLSPPTDFDLKTEYDLIDEYKQADESQMPDYIKQNMAVALVDKIYGGDDVIVKKSNVINYLDPYSVTTPEDKVIMITNGVADADTIRFSNTLPNLLNRLLTKRGKDWFINADYDTIETEVMAIFKAQPKPVQPKAPTSERVVV